MNTTELIRSERTWLLPRVRSAGHANHKGPIFVESVEWLVFSALLGVLVGMLWFLAHAPVQLHVQPNPAAIATRTPSAAFSPRTAPTVRPVQPGVHPSAITTPSTAPTGLRTKVAPTTSAEVRHVTPGAFCAPAGAIGETEAGVAMTCRSTTTDARNRWRSLATVPTAEPITASAVPSSGPAPTVSATSPTITHSTYTAPATTAP